MSLELQEMVEAFAASRVARLRELSEDMDSVRLEDVVAFLQEMRRESEAVGEAVRDGDADLYDGVWVPLLKEVLDLIPKVMAPLKEVRGDALGRLQGVQKGMHSLSGYGGGSKGSHGELDTRS